MLIKYELRNYKNMIPFVKDKQLQNVVSKQFMRQGSDTIGKKDSYRQSMNRLKTLGML